MAYAQNGLIEALDFNTFRSQLQNVYGVGFGDSGYGQTAIVVPAVLGGFVEQVKADEWRKMRNALRVSALHQGTSTALIPPLNVLDPNDVITAHDGITNADDFPQSLTDITNNRLLAAPTSTSVFLSRSSQSVTAAWTTQARTVVDLTWPSADDARYFFNSGGEIIMRSSRSGGSANLQNTSWTDLLNNVASIVLNYDNTVNTGSTGTGSTFGYYDLPSVAPKQLIFEAQPPSGGTYYYDPNRFQVLARTFGVSGVNGDNGLTIRLEVLWDDNFVGGSDAVDGTLTLDIDERRATTELTIPSFTVNLVTPLSVV